MSHGRGGVTVGFTVTKDGVVVTFTRLWLGIVWVAAVPVISVSSA
jgi:hypothetical protein